MMARVRYMRFLLVFLGSAPDQAALDPVFKIKCTQCTAGQKKIKKTFYCFLASNLANLSLCTIHWVQSVYDFWQVGNIRVLGFWRGCKLAF